MNKVTRRHALKVLGCAGLCAASGPAALRFAWAENTERRLVFVFLRGGLDGLSAVPAWGEPSFARLRSDLALPAPGSAGGALKLDGLFALHPMLANVHAMFQSGECAVLHAVASPYRERSHFDAQNVMETGSAQPHAREAGWLNLALESIGATDAAKSGIALAQTVPLVLRGPAPVGTWSPSVLPEPDSDLLARLAEMYSGDPLFSKAFAAARESEAMADSAMDNGMGGARPKGGAIPVLAKAAGAFLARPDGPRVATIDIGGWDTHANQSGEMGPLARNLRVLDESLAALKDSLGPAWKQTVAIIVTEFGRTVAMNGSHGTDHGTAAAAFVLGGAVRGGKVIADWPGLGPDMLYEGRDLRPTADLRSVFKGALIAQLRVTESALETGVFPGSRAVKPLGGLFA